MISLESTSISGLSDKELPSSDTVALVGREYDNNQQQEELKSTIDVHYLKDTLFLNSQRRIVGISVVYLILFVLTIMLLVCIENIFHQGVVLDPESILWENGQPNRRILYSVTLSLLLNQLVTFTCGLLCGGLSLNKVPYLLHMTISVVFVTSSILFQLFTLAEMAVFGLLAGKRMFDHAYIPFVIMALFQIVMLVLTTASVIIMIRHWEVAKIHRARSVIFSQKQSKESEVSVVI